MKEEKLTPEEWFEKEYLKSDHVYGSSVFSDKAVIDILKAYEKYLHDGK